ncbi:MAG: hypothetical protein ISQ13_05220 [Candidatus Margulisbacteria bacterium]|nr:hypothetical protein [Candidatus Margulisiibacteriota bacterium]
MAIEFYNVKKRKKVSIDETGITKVEYKRETAKGIQVRYAFRAQDDDGTNLTKFVSKADYDRVDAPVAA